MFEIRIWSAAATFAPAQQDRKPDRTGIAAPAIAQTNSGEFHGRAITPNIAMALRGPNSTRISRPSRPQSDRLAPRSPRTRASFGSGLAWRVPGVKRTAAHRSRFELD